MKILRSLAIAVLAIVVSAPCHAANEGHDPLTTLDALNHALVSIYRVERQPSKVTVDEEYNGIINNLAVGNITEDSELRDLFAKMMDAYTENRLDAKDRDMLRRQYEAQVNRAFLEVKPLSHIRTEAAWTGAKELVSTLSDTSKEDPWYKTLFKVGGSVVGSLGDYQIALQANERIRMQAQGQEQEYMQQRMAGEWELDKERIRRFNALKGSLLDAGWALLNRYNLPDEYRLTENNLDQFYPFISEKDVKKAIRMGKRLEANFSKYPPYWFYMGSFYLQDGDVQEARACFDKFEEVNRPIFRKDAYAAANARYKMFTLDEKEKDEAQRLLDIIEKQVAPDDWNTVLFAALQNYQLGNKQKAEELVLQNIDNGHDVALNKEILHQMQRGKLDFAAVQGVAIREFKEPSQLEKLAKAGNPEAQYVYGLLQSGERRKFWMEQAAQQGHFFAKCRLIYDDPKNYENEIKDIFAELNTKSETGNAPAQNYLGLFYRKGIGTAKDDKKAFSLYHKAAEQGLAVAQVNLGACYLKGIGTAKDAEKAFSWFQKAAEQTSALGETWLGFCYQNGLGTTKDGNKAFSLFQKAAQQGLATANFELGKCFQEGIGTAKDDKKAISCYLQAANQGNPHAQNRLGRCFEDGMGTLKDAKKAFEWYEKAAEQGLAVAQVNLGGCYLNGRGTTKEEQKAFFWYQKAAEQGNVIGQNALGWCYEYGIGTLKDTAKAIELYEMAAERGYGIAQVNLGNCYLDGIGTAKNGQKAFFWYQKAADQGNASGQGGLAYCYEHGIGVQKDTKKAIEWYEKAADQGLPAAQVNLGICYQAGIATIKDEQRAFSLFQKAADQGDAAGQNRLGLCYENGIGTQKNAIKALEWYEKSAEQGYVQAQINLANCYLGEIGGIKKSEKAFFWFQKAAEQGSALGQNGLGLCYWRGIGARKDDKKAFEWIAKAADQGLAVAQNNLAFCYQEGIGCAKDKAQARVWYQKAANQGYGDAKKALQEL